MKKTYDLSQLDWKLSGWIPFLWRMEQSMEVGASANAEIPAIPAKVPGSVQDALHKSEIIPDWNYGLNFRECEWVENRDWIFEAPIPDEWIQLGKTYRLNCLGLDYCGEVFVNSVSISDFKGSFTPHVFDITSALKLKGNVVRIVFEPPPRWLGQFGYTSRMKEWKVRFNYTWDWTARLVQIGIWDSVLLEITDDIEIKEFRCVTSADLSNSTGSMTMVAKISDPDSSARLSLASADGKIIREETVSASLLMTSGVAWRDLPVELWWPNLEGDQPLYNITCALLNKDGVEVDKVVRRIGFKNVTWEPCEDSPENSDPWICVVNGRKVFLQGVNWTPILPNFADVTEDDYREILEIYRELGINILRVWGGAFLEKEWFYNICDELGLMVWQEFPLSSSGIDNYPPDDEDSIEALAKIAELYILRRQHHVSLMMWSGGNELMELDNTPVDTSHPLINRLEQIVYDQDPTRRFVPSSASGPMEWVQPENVGKGLHWDVHGPWKGGKLEEWLEYWKKDDALFRSETGSPGASSVEIIEKYAGGHPTMPPTHETALWRRTSIWWIELGEFLQEFGREPESLEEYVTWQQERQKYLLSIAAQACKSRFPKCGGFIIWMGHDCFPCNANTAIIDFHRKPKPAALEIGRIFRKKV